MADTAQPQFTQEDLSDLFAGVSGIYNLGPVSIHWSKAISLPPAVDLDITVYYAGKLLGKGNLTNTNKTLTFKGKPGPSQVIVTLTLDEAKHMVDVKVSIGFLITSGSFSY